MARDRSRRPATMRTAPMTLSCSLRVPWEKSSWATFVSPIMIRSMTSGECEVGHRVRTVIVCAIRFPWPHLDTLNKIKVAFMALGLFPHEKYISQVSRVDCQLISMGLTT